MKKIIRRVLWALLGALVLFVVWFAWPRLPIITAFAAKGMCSSVFLAEKAPDRVEAEDLSFFPISLARSRVDTANWSVTSTVFGLAKRTAVFRDGAGAVLVLDSDPETVRETGYALPEAPFDPDTVAWPLGDVLPGAVPAGVDLAKIRAVLDDAFDRPGDEPLKKTLGVAVVYKDTLLGERYLEGYDAGTRFHGWSMTKSITGALAGALVTDGRLDIHAPTGIPAWQQDERSAITTDQVLHMTTGLEWVENYFTISEATVMLMQSSDMLASVTACPLAHEPGTHWSYSSGDANLLSGIVRRSIGNDAEYHAYPYTRLFHRIGMLHTTVETDASGLFVASSYSYGTVRDWARFGILMENGGVFRGDTVLAPSWVEYMSRTEPVSDGFYGATFWLKEPSEEQALTDVPADVFFADGFLGQRVYVIPSRDLVVVRMGYSLSDFNLNDFLKKLLEALPE
ncbi:MAG: serine hydrolase [Bacteroidales bacterium]